MNNVERKHPAAICEKSLTNSNQLMIVDESESERVGQLKWYLTPEGYVKCTSHIPRRFLHQFVMQTSEEIDHINRDRLDNRKENLRICTRGQNLGNSIPRGGSSRFKGVYWNKTNEKWIANITLNYKCKYLGSFTVEEDAARAYDEAAKEHFGEFARTNF